MFRNHFTSVPWFSRGTAAVCTLLAVMLLMFSVDAAQAATTLNSLGNTSNCTINAGITSGTCTETVDTGGSVVLTAEADPVPVSGGWTNCDTPAEDRCTVTRDADKTVTAILEQINTPPVADAGPDQTVPVGAAVNLDGSGSTGAETYSWLLTTVPTDSTASLTGADTASPSFVADLAGTYVAELVVNEGTEDSALDSVTITAETTGLVGSWSFEEGAGITANDDSGNGNTGILENGTAWVSGVVGNSGVKFDGTDDRVRVANRDSLDFGPGEDFSISFWMRDSTLGPNATGSPELLEKQGATGGFYQIRSPNSSGALRVQISDGANQDFFNTNAGNLADGLWHHVVVIRDYDAGISAYVDGESAGSNNVVTAGSPANNGDLLLGGANTNVGSYDGEMDQLRLYQKALSGAEIAALFAEASAPVPPVAEAGADQDVLVGATVTLDGSGSTGAETYAWTLITVPEFSNATASLTGADTASPGFVADLAGTYLAELVVNNGTEDSAPDTVSITAHESLQAEPSFTLLHDPSDGATGLKVDITRVFDPATGEDAAVPLGSFQAQLTYEDPSSDPSLPPGSRCVNILAVREMAIPITIDAIDNQAGAATFHGSLASGVFAPNDLGHALTRLAGGANQLCQVRLELTSLGDVGSNPISVPTLLSQTVQRGDARADGNVSIADALFIAQYLAGLRPACSSTVDTSCLHSVNAASVGHDGEFDENNIVDARLVAEFLVGLRDEFYNPAP